VLTSLPVQSDVCVQSCTVSVVTQYDGMAVAHVPQYDVSESMRQLGNAEPSGFSSKKAVAQHSGPPSDPAQSAERVHPAVSSGAQVDSHVGVAVVRPAQQTPASAHGMLGHVVGGPLSEPPLPLLEPEPELLPLPLDPLPLDELPLPDEPPPLELPPPSPLLTTPLVAEEPLVHAPQTRAQETATAAPNQTKPDVRDTMKPPPTDRETLPRALGSAGQPGMRVHLPRNAPAERAPLPPRPAPAGASYGLNERASNGTQHRS